MTSRHPLRPLSVLIADNSAEVGDALRTLLVHWGFQARAAYDRDAALAELASDEPDVVLLDMNMPGAADEAGGLLGYVTRIGARRPLVVALTGFRSSQGGSGRDGVDHFLRHPYDLDELRHILDGHQARVLQQLDPPPPPE
jgi:CheY-like chemotaxis protein